MDAAVGARTAGFYKQRLHPPPLAQITPSSGRSETILLLKVNKYDTLAARVRIVRIAVENWNLEFLKHKVARSPDTRQFPATPEHV